MIRKLRARLIDKLAGNDIAVLINLDISVGKNTDSLICANIEEDFIVFTRSEVNFKSNSRYLFRQLHI